MTSRGASRRRKHFAMQQRCNHSVTIWTLHLVTMRSLRAIRVRSEQTASPSPPTPVIRRPTSAPRCVSVCLCVCVCMCVCGCVYLCMPRHTHTHTDTYTHMHIAPQHHTHTYTCTHQHKYSPPTSITHILTHTHTSHTHKHTQPPSIIHAHTHTNTLTHIHGQPHNMTLHEVLKRLRLRTLCSCALPPLPSRYVNEG